MRVKRYTRFGEMDFPLTSKEVEEAYMCHQRQIDLSDAKQAANALGYGDVLEPDDYNLIVATYRNAFDKRYSSDIQLKACIKSYIREYLKQNGEPEYSKEDELKTLCRRNGRTLISYPGGKYETVDFYEACDRQFFETIDEAMEWEKGYAMVP